MQFSKATLLPILGILVFIFFIALSYFNNLILLDKILVSTAIVGLVVLAKIIGEGSIRGSKSDSRKVSDSN